MPRGRVRDLLACCLGLVLGAGQALAGGTEDMEAYLAADGRLKSELVLRDAQSGFAGVTADVWQVAPDGSYRVTRELDGRGVAPERTGSLGPDQVAELARALSDQDLTTMPAEIGQAAEINARQLTLRFGDTATTLNLMPGQDLENAACSAAPRSDFRRFVEIAMAITHALEAGDRPEADGDPAVRCID